MASASVGASMSRLGLAVTWDNPDIWLTRNGDTVPSWQLEPNTDYQIVARIWNGSTQAPAVAMPVHFSVLHFGVGTVPDPIGTATVTVGVKGAPDQPALVSVPWHTPPIEGHYCIQVRLDPVDDLNYANNLGQENTLVGHAHSPVEFAFALRNSGPEPEQYRFAVDAYALREPSPCPPSTPDGAPATGLMVPGAYGQPPASADPRLSSHLAGHHPLPPGWVVDLDPASLSLYPEQQITVRVVVTPPTGWSGRQAVNVNALTASGLAGGVTFTVVAGSEG